MRFSLLFCPAQPLACAAWVLAGLGTAGCLAATSEAPARAYHNPLDLVDAGSDGGVPPLLDAGSAGGPKGQGPVDGRSPTLVSATYDVQRADAGGGATDLTLADVASLCAALGGDGGLGSNWDVVHLRLDGDGVGSYPVGPVLSPGGAIATFEFQSNQGSFGSAVALSGSVEVNGLDRNNRESASGSYTLSFAADGGAVLFGRFSATPCMLVPPAPGG